MRKKRWVDSRIRSNMRNKQTPGAQGWAPCWALSWFTPSMRLVGHNSTVPPIFQAAGLIPISKVPLAEIIDVAFVKGLSQAGTVGEMVHELLQPGRRREAFCVAKWQRGEHRLWGETLWVGWAPCSFRSHWALDTCNNLSCSSLREGEWWTLLYGSWFEILYVKGLAFLAYSKCSPIIIIIGVSFKITGSIN